VLGDDLAGFYYTYNDKTYYYCETTGDGWEIGELPPEFKDEKAYIYEIREHQQYVPESWIAPSVTPSPSPEIPEFPSSIVLPLFIMATFAGILVYKRKHF
jgi:hypothetical protein